MRVEKEKILAIVGREFNYPMDFKFVDIVVGLLERVLDDERVEDDPTNTILEAIDCYLIWFDDQWTVRKFYQTPSEANFDKAMWVLFQDCYNILEKILGGNQNER